MKTFFSWKAETCAIKMIKTSQKTWRCFIHTSLVEERWTYVGVVIQNSIKKRYTPSYEVEYNAGKMVLFSFHSTA
jgi:hypothetical protein